MQFSVSVERMLKAFHLGFNEFWPMWEGVLSEAVLGDLKKLKPEKSTFYIPDPVWVRVVYDFAIAVHRQAMPREHLLKSLTSLYLG